MEDISGRRFGRLTAVELVNVVRYGKTTHARWLFKCDCGNLKVINRGNVIRELTKSCGCLSKEMAIARSTTHGQASGGKFSGSYQSWRSMKERTSRPLPRYAGVNLCDEWRAYKNFLRDMGERPEGMTLDRIDNNKGYSRENCRWATLTVQNHNRRKVAGTTSKYKGVNFYVGRWFAAISFNRKKINLGSFCTEIEAARAYNEGAKRFHGEFASLNEIELLEETTISAGRLGQ